jgi:hypothetical protein
MAIRLHGEEAVNQAYYAEGQEGATANSRLFVEKEGKKVSLSPQKALQLVNDGTIEPESLTCYVLSVWDLLTQKEFGRSIVIRQCPNTALVFTRDYGAEIGGGVRGCAVSASTFDGAVRWAMDSPAIDLDFDRDEFIVRLHPRLLLRKGAWQQDVELLRHAREIADALTEVFGIDPKSVWKELKRHSKVDQDGEPVFHGGNMLDVVLEQAQNAIERDPSKMSALRDNAG